MTKKVIITGTSRGIGLELVKVFAKQNHNVLALSRNHSVCKGLNDPNIKSLAFDITSASSITSVKKYVQTHWEKADILINNAGYLVKKPFAELSFIDFKKSYEVNVFGLVAFTQELLPCIKKDGHIINIGSMGGVQGSAKFPGLAAYSSSKGALTILTELLAEEYKNTGPSFNMLALGAVQTEMLEEAFPGYQAPLSAKKMAQYICDFSLDGNQYYNGKVLQVSNNTP